THRVEVHAEHRMLTYQGEHQFPELLGSEAVGFGFGLLTDLGQQSQCTDVTRVVLLGYVRQESTRPGSTSSSTIRVGQRQPPQLRGVSRDPASLTDRCYHDGRGEQLSLSRILLAVTLLLYRRGVFQV